MGEIRAYVPPEVHGIDDPHLEDLPIAGYLRGHHALNYLIDGKQVLGHVFRGLDGPELETECYEAAEVLVELRDIFRRCKDVARRTKAENPRTRSPRNE